VKDLFVTGVIVTLNQFIRADKPRELRQSLTDKDGLQCADVTHCHHKIMSIRTQNDRGQGENSTRRVRSSWRICNRRRKRRIRTFRSRQPSRQMIVSGYKLDLME